MKVRTRRLQLSLMIVATLIMIITTSCNLGAPPQDAQTDLTEVPTGTGAAPTRTLLPTGSASTSVAVTSIPFPSQFPQNTSVAQLPSTAIPFPTSTPLPISIVILSPLPGNIIAGNIQILGSAIHPEFLQYRVEFGPDPNPNNLWFPITGVVQTPILNSVLGIWNTTTAAAPDGRYQIRLRLFLRDGREISTVVNNVTVQNRQPTPIPTSTPNIPRPVAGFTQDYTSGNAPLVVTFTNLSQGQIDSYGWNFGDGGNSNKKNPTHTFKTPGVYMVQLTVKGPGGQTNVSRQINVKSPSAPIANFTVNPNSGTAPLNVKFNNTTSGNATSYAWNFGDGETSTNTSPNHTYTSVGTYNVILEAKSPGGSTTSIRQVTVNNPQIPPPVAGFDVSTQTGEVPLILQMTNTTTGQVTAYLWDFNGDNVTDSVDKDPSHTYSEDGEFTISLIAIGPGGQSTVSKTITAINPPDAPTASFTANPLTGNAPLNVQFTNTSTGDATGYAWDFQNDGQPDSTDTSPAFTFNDAGTYEVKLVANGPGGSTSATQTITVTTPLEAPIADFVADKTSGENPLTVNFTNQSQGSELTYAWDFETDGTVDSTENSPIHDFTEANTYTVTLTVTNAVGSDSASATIEVSDTVVIQPPTAAFTANPTTGEGSINVNFTNQSAGDITSYEWDFETDGTVDSTDTSPSHQFGVGNYTVTLKAIGPGGSTTTTTQITVTEPIPAPVAGFTSTPTDLDVAFTSTSTGDNLTFAWDFGDGSTSTDANPSHTYAAGGAFNVTLTVSNSAGSNSITQAVTVTAPVQAPIAGFTAAPTDLTAAFTSTSTGDNLTFAWDFGDGSTSTDANPSHSYAADGTYNVTLTVSNSAGSNSITQAVTVNAPVQAPVAGFTAAPTDLTAAFTSTSTGDNLSYAWDFGDGSTSTDANPSHSYAAGGTFNVTLTVSNDGGTNAITQQVTVTAPVQAPVAGFTAAPTDLDVAFTSTSTGDNLTYAWDFDDGATSTDANPSHSYAAGGTFNVTLTVSNDGGTNAITQQVTVTAPIQAPVAGFTAAPTDLTAAFTSTSTGDNLSYAWDFGDGSTSTDANPSHTYAIGGAYNVTLTVSNDGGTNAITQQVTVAEPAGPALPTGEIVFVSNRDGNNEIYVMNTDGTNAVNVTNNPADDLQPDWSPDGSKVVFVSERDSGRNIYVLTIDSLQVQRLTTDSGENIQPVWSPDGSKIAFASNRFGDNDVFVMNADGSDQQQRTFDTSDDNSPTWSPDNSKLAYVSDINGNRDIFVITSSDGSPVLTLVDDAKDDYQPMWLNRNDNSILVFTSDRNDDADLFVINPNDGSNLTQLMFDSSNESDASWSPDGSRIIFTSDRDDGGTNNLYAFNLGNQNVNRITPDGSNDRQADWK